MAQRRTTSEILGDLVDGGGAGRAIADEVRPVGRQFQDVAARILDAVDADRALVHQHLDTEIHPRSGFS